MGIILTPFKWLKEKFGNLAGFLGALFTGLILTIIALPLLALLPVINLDVVSIVQGNVFGYIRAGLYFLPVSTVARILGFSLSLYAFRIIVAVVRTVWDLLPFA